MPNREKQKILFLIHEMTMGGAQRVISNLLNGLERELFDVHLALFKKKGVLLENIREDVTIHDLNASRVIFGTHKLVELIFRERPDVVFTGITHVNLMVAIFMPLFRRRLKGTKFITREVNIPSIRAKYMKKSKRMDSFYKRRILRFDTVVAQSNFMKQDIMKSYALDESKVVVINNPLDRESIKRKLEEKHERLLPEGKLNIVATGMLRKQKGFEQLLEVMPLLDERFHLNIVGEGGEREALELKIRELNIGERVTLLGLQKNPYIYMEEADIVVLSSLYEGFPNVILEANACGKFVVAFRCPGVSEEIIMDNVNGLLVEDKNIDAFASAIERYATVEHNREEIIETVERYAVESVVDSYKALFLK
jgi:glycosyltransferase involved in cell wall biosynthesis